jgi:hypothetical protein
VLEIPHVLAEPIGAPQDNFSVHQLVAASTA